MRNVVLILLVLLLATSALAQDDAKVAALEKRVQKLEQRVAELEAIVAPVLAKTQIEKQVEKQRMMARDRMRKDAAVYTPDQLREIETLYQVANRKWRSQEGKDSLKELVSKFDKANRTGCALLYLGQMSAGKEKQQYLQKAIDGFSDCYYGDGVQVGPYARLHLAHYCKQQGEDEKAEKLFKEIADKYPHAIDHQGRPLSDSLKK